MGAMAIYSGTVGSEVESGSHLPLEAAPVDNESDRERPREISRVCKKTANYSQLAHPYSAETACT